MGSTFCSVHLSWTSFVVPRCEDAAWFQRCFNRVTPFALLSFNCDLLTDHQRPFSRVCSISLRGRFVKTRFQHEWFGQHVTNPFSKTVSTEHFHRSCSVCPNMLSCVCWLHAVHRTSTRTTQNEQPSCVFAHLEEKRFESLFISIRLCLLVPSQHYDMCCSLCRIWYSGWCCESLQLSDFPFELVTDQCLAPSPLVVIDIHLVKTFPAHFDFRDQSINILKVIERLISMIVSFVVRSDRDRFVTISLALVFSKKHPHTHNTL